MKALRLLALCSVVSTSMLFAQTPAAKTSSAPAATTKTNPAAPNAAAIADAKSKGQVWVNLNTKVYHQSTASQYGTTKNGKFMSEADAKSAGYRAAKDTPAKPKATTAK